MAASADDPTVTLALVPGKTAFSFMNVDGVPVEVPVTMSRTEDIAHWPVIFASQHFQTWAQQYERNAHFTLSAITIQSVKLCGSSVVSIVLEPHFSTPDVHCSSIVLGGTETVGSRKEVGVLTILRCMSTPTPSSGGRRPRDFVVFTAQERPALPHQSHLEIMKGTFGEDGVLEGTAASEFHDLIDVHINLSDLVSLTRDKAERGVVASASCCPTPLPLYLFRLNISESELDKLQLASSAGAETKTSLLVISLGEAWKMTSDACSMAALFLFHEFRYHGLMPKYRPPKDAKQPEIVYEKRKPKFLPVDDLDPHVSGANLRVKVVETYTQESVREVVRREGKTKEATITVGDSTGIVRMKLDGEQLDIEGVNKVGACITVRNGKIDVVNTKMVLSVSKWGKVIVESAEENAEEFAFTVDQANDKSAIEYELVSMFDDGLTNSPPPQTMRRGVGPRRGGGGRPMRRGGFRGVPRR